MAKKYRCMNMKCINYNRPTSTPPRPFKKCVCGSKMKYPRSSKRR